MFDLAISLLSDLTNYYYNYLNKKYYKFLIDAPIEICRNGQRHNLQTLIRKYLPTKHWESKTLAGHV